MHLFLHKNVYLKKKKQTLMVIFLGTERNTLLSLGWSHQLTNQLGVHVDFQYFFFPLSLKKYSKTQKQ